MGINCEFSINTHWDYTRKKFGIYMFHVQGSNLWGQRNVLSKWLRIIDSDIYNYRCNKYFIYFPYNYVRV